MDLEKLLNACKNFVWTLIVIVLSPILEKNPRKVAHLGTPLVLSGSRSIVVVFSYGMYFQMKKIGIAGWPESTLCIALVYALPILNALDRSSPKDILEFGKTIINRFGVGAVRTVGNLYKGDPETSVDRENEVIDG